MKAIYFVLIAAVCAGYAVGYAAGSNIPDRDLKIARTQCRADASDSEVRARRCESELQYSKYQHTIELQNLEQKKFPRDWEKWEQVKRAAVKACSGTKGGE